MPRFFSLMLLGLCLTSCLSGSSHRAVERVVVSEGWLAMGTFFDVELRVRAGEVEKANAWINWSRAEIARLEKIYSRHDPESEVSRLNEALRHPAGLRRGALAEKELEALLVGGMEVWRASGGAFDMTVGPLIDLWERAAEEARWPPVASLRRAKERVGSDRLLLMGEGRVSLEHSGMRIDLDGISKGAVLDRLRAELDQVLPSVPALLSFGQSSVLALGDPEHEGAAGGWRLAVHSRDPAVGRLAVLRLRDQALSVSSSVGRIMEIGGESLSHVIDPRTGAAVRGVVEAVVVADRAMIADGWSTAMLVLGARRESLRLIERGGPEAYVFERGGRDAGTEGWGKLLVDPY